MKRNSSKNRLFFERTILIEERILLMEKQYKTILKDEAFLRQISKPIDWNKNDYHEAIKQLDMFCQEDENLLALAAVQVGIPLRMIYLKKTDLTRLEDDYNERTILINPVITKRVGKTTYWESCASCLDYMGLVERPYKIELAYQDEKGQAHTQTFEGFPATVLSHEMDHLDGILHIDIAKEILNMPQEERKEFRKTHPYEILSKTEQFVQKTKKKSS